MPAIEALEKLESAYLKDNLLTDVNALFQPGLKTLTLEGNPLVELPETIGRAVDLELLNVATTKLRSLPASLTTLPKLHSLFLDGTEPVPGAPGSSSCRRP